MSNLRKKANGTRKKSTRKVATGAKEIQPHCLVVSEAGIRSAGDFAAFSSLLVSDIIAGRITPIVANSATRAGANLLKVTEMQLRYGGRARSGLMLVENTPLGSKEPKLTQ